MITNPCCNKGNTTCYGQFNNTSEQLIPTMNKLVSELNYANGTPLEQMLECLGRFDLCDFTRIGILTVTDIA